MAASDFTSQYTQGEEVANSVIHGLGIVLSIAGLGLLTAFSTLKGNAWHIVSCSIFGTTLILMYTASTLYHALPNPKAKRLMRTLDHAAIFLLIAGTYTPLTLVSLRGPGGWILFGVIWALAVLGVVVKSLTEVRKSRFSLAVYILMGWAGIFALLPLTKSMAVGGLLLLVLGGIAYSVGIIFYVWRKLPYHHAIWHGFVLMGSVLHFLAILLYVIPI